MQVMMIFEWKLDAKVCQSLFRGLIMIMPRKKRYFSCFPESALNFACDFYIYIYFAPKINSIAAKEAIFPLHVYLIEQNVFQKLKIITLTPETFRA